VMLVKRGLHGMEVISIGQPLDGGDRGAGRLRRHHGARFDGAAIQMDHAGPALPGIAPHMRPGQAQRLAQELDQEGSVFDLPRHGTPVDLDIDLSHLAPSPFWYTNTSDDRGLARKERKEGGLHPVTRNGPNSVLAVAK